MEKVIHWIYPPNPGCQTPAGLFVMLSRKTQQMLVTYLLLLDINIWFKSDHLRYVFLFDRCIVCISCSLMWLCLHSLVSLWHLSEFLWSIHHPNHYQPKQCTTNYELWYTKETPGNYHIYTCIKFHAPAKLCNLTIPVFFRKKNNGFRWAKATCPRTGLAWRPFAEEAPVFLATFF